VIGQELLDAVAADADIPVVEVDGRVAVAGDEADLVAEARSSVGRFITVAQTKRLGAKALVGAPSRSRLRP
jgi:hypothetical protein